MFLPLIRSRRSIRRYSDEAVTDAVMDQIVEAALRAPSSRGLNPWEFIVVTEQETVFAAEASEVQVVVSAPCQRRRRGAGGPRAR